MQKPDIEKAMKVLADAEHSNHEYLRKAHANPASANQSEIFPPGTEYALGHAEAQLMYAVCAVLNASYIESVKGLLKMRKAYATLHDIAETQKKYLERIGARPASVKSASIRPISRDSSAIIPPPLSNGNVATVNGATAIDEDDEDDDDDFQDAEEDLSESPVSHRYQGKLDVPGLEKLNLNGHANGHAKHSNQARSVASMEADPADWEDFDFNTVTTDPIDIYVSGLALATVA